jgi:glyoxylase-like metal-dependent hydrolase (beta-lactamase superfamily II)
LLFLGGGHTPGDIVAYLPREKVLIAGDLIMSDRVFPGFYFPVAYRGSLAVLAEMDFTVLLPGHGPKLRGKSYLHMVRDLSDYLVNEVKNGVDKGMLLPQIQNSIDLSDFRARFAKVNSHLAGDFDRRMPRAIANIYRDLTAASNP